MSRPRNAWHESHRTTAAPRLPRRSVEAIAARNRSAADLAAALKVRRVLLTKEGGAFCPLGGA